MSVEAIKAFQLFLEKDETARNEVAALKMDDAAIVSYANAKGFDFSLETLTALRKGEAELDMESLGDVSGGTRVGALVTTVTAVGVVLIIS
ncbi:Nif11-like leader peptide family natural product precursor [Fusibacter paucivorans]|uniref:Nif11-like leader peptide family natural product n=1 Tax=Fusibacter paucivorans TaxID=76009 RepID=A0ABS5PK31_9FIRM|nr:Nif11 family protein [Fusibacter paucivorans]MBS7525356.1 Nif11-like leader peptide family natural product precursor [Fusibacter paucivorans]